MHTQITFSNLSLLYVRSEEERFSWVGLARRSPLDALLRHVPQERVRRRTASNDYGHQQEKERLHFAKQLELALGHMT